MRVKVYLDIFFLWNWCLNFVLITITGYTIRQKVSLRKRLIAAAIGAVCAIGAIIGKKTLPAIICYFAAIYLMIRIAFGFYSILQIVKIIVVFLTTAFCIAGILLSFFEQEKNYMKKMVCMQLGEWKGSVVFEVFLGISFVLPIAAFFYFRKVIPQTQEFFYQVTLRKGGYQYKTVGYMDSGNSLVEPATRLPVILMEAEEMKEFLHTPVPLEGEIPIEQEFLWQAVPYHSAGKEHGILWGLKLDELILEKDGEQWKTNEVMAAACHHLFSEVRKKEGYSVLLHRSFANLKKNCLLP